MLRLSAAPPTAASKKRALQLRPREEAFGNELTRRGPLWGAVAATCAAQHAGKPPPHGVRHAMDVWIGARGHLETT